MKFLGVNPSTQSRGVEFIISFKFQIALTDDWTRGSRTSDRFPYPVVHDERVNTLRIDNRQWPSLVPGALCTSYNPALVNLSTIKLEIGWNVHAR